jgi:hypothetical protein
MKLIEIYDDYDDAADARYDAKMDAMHDDWEASHSGDFIISEYDGVQPDDAVVSMFDIRVEYEVEDHGHTDHPYGQGTAREEHGSSVNVTVMETNEEVTYHHPETDEIIKTFPKGTDCGDLPGWEESDTEYVQRKAEDHAS